ncbi:MAG: ribosome recycling factor [Candidatus Dormiibacterota bacterium]
MSEPNPAEDARRQMEERLVDAEVRMEKSVDALHKELGGIRTGRASPSLVERLQVEYYGTPTPLQSIAGISTPEARLLVIRPYERSMIGPIEKAIQRSELSLTPTNDGEVIRIGIPQLTEERRRDLVRLCARHAEEAKVSVRNIRRDENDYLRRVEREGHVSRDDVESSIAEIQRITDQFIARIDEVVKRKEAEILEV